MSQNALGDCRCASTACLVDTFTGRVEKCLAESTLVRHVWGRPLVYVCNFWDSIKCHRLHRMTADGVNALPLHALLTHV